MKLLIFILKSTCFFAAARFDLFHRFWTQWVFILNFLSIISHTIFNDRFSINRRTSISYFESRVERISHLLLLDVIVLKASFLLKLVLQFIVLFKSSTTKLACLKLVKRSDLIYRYLTYLFHILIHMLSDFSIWSNESLSFWFLSPWLFFWCLTGIDLLAFLSQQFEQR